jgi:hypothetical protein
MTAADVLARAEKVEQLDRKIISETREADRRGGQKGISTNDATKVLDLWTERRLIDPATELPLVEGDMQLTALKSRYSQIAERQLSLARLMAKEPGALAGSRAALIDEYESDLVRLDEIIGNLEGEIMRGLLGEGA